MLLVVKPKTLEPTSPINAIMISFSSNQINLITDFILDTYSFVSTTQQRDNAEDFYYFNGQFYELGAEGLIFDVITHNFPTVSSRSTIWAIIDKVQRLSPTISKDQINPTGITNYINGLYFHSENKLKPHTPKVYTTKQHPQNYVNECKNSLSQQAKLLEYLNYL